MERFSSRTTKVLPALHACILSLFLMSLSVCNSRCLAQDSPFMVLQDDFKQWIPYYFGPDTEGGQLEMTDEGLTLSFRNKGIYGLYNVREFGGNFDAQVDLGFAEGAGSGIMLIKEKDGKPDPDNYVGLKKSIGGGSKEMVEVFAIKDGEDLIEEFLHWHPRFEYVLDSDSFGYEAKALRIAKDAKANCLHFYYKYEREIDGEVCDGWMEFSTLPDWGQDSFFLYLYVESNVKVLSRGLFSSALVKQTLTDDLSDSGTGFNAVRREYTFSGFTGDAVVVTFDSEFPFYETSRFVFWSEANYIPWWHIDDKCAVSYEFCETWDGGTEGCCEPMSDRLLRWSKVDIVEANKVRVIVHWRYVLADPEYRWWGMSPDEKPYADECFCFYPDGTGVRKLTYTPSLNSDYDINWNEISELIVIARGGVKPSEFLSQTAISMLNLQGERLDFLWDLSQEEPPVKMPPETKQWPEAICRVNLLDRPAVFEVFAQGEKTHDKTFPYPYETWWGNYGADWAFEMRGWYEFKDDFWTFSHWPVSMIPYDEPDKTPGKYIREVSHTSLLPVPGAPEVDGPTTWAMLVGLSHPGNDQELRDKTFSWLYPGDIKMLNDSSKFVENDYYQRALVFDNVKGNQKCHFTIDPAAQSSVVVNPVFLVTNWGNHSVSLKQDGKLLEVGNDYRYEIIDNNVLIWVKTSFKASTTFVIES